MRDVLTPGIIGFIGFLFITILVIAMSCFIPSPKKAELLPEPVRTKFFIQCLQQGVSVTDCGCVELVIKAAVDSRRAPDVEAIQACLPTPQETIL